METPRPTDAIIFCDGVKSGLGVNSLDGIVGEGRDMEGCVRGEGGDGEGVSVIVGSIATDAIVGVNG